MTSGYRGVDCRRLGGFGRVSDLVTTRLRIPFVLVALVAVAALVGTSCSAVTPQALTVDDYSLSESDFMDELASIAANQAYLDSRAQQGSPVVPAGTNDATFSTAFTSQFLNERVSFVLAEQENEARGLEVTEADRRNAEVLLSLNLSPNAGQSDGATADPAGLAALDEFSDSYRTALVDGVANVLVLRRDILDRASTEEGLRALYAAREDDLRDQACVSHILIRAGSGQSQPTAGGAGRGADADRRRRRRAGRHAELRRTGRGGVRGPGQRRRRW